MSDESYNFSTARARLEDIVAQVRKKDTSLEKSLDLLEEGVRLANSCTELIDHADWSAGDAGVEGDGEGATVAAAAVDAATPTGEVAAADGDMRERDVDDDAEASEGDASAEGNPGDMGRPFDTEV
jgi:exodeoxyribonuclease VII small subunit